MILSSSGWLYTCTTLEWTLRNLRNSLDCDGHATLFPDCNPWFKETPTRSVGTIYLCSQRTTPNTGANVLATNCENNIHQKIWTINIFISRSLHNGIPSLNRFSLPESSSEATAVFVLRIHGRLGLQEPLRHGVVAFEGCLVQRCFASGAANPRRKPQGRTQTERRGEKFWENFGYLKSRSFGNCGHSKSSLHLTNTVVLRCPGDIVLVPKNCFLWCSIEAVSAMFAINMDLDKLKHTPQNFLVRVSCHRPNSHMNWRNIGSNYEDLHIMIISSSGCVHATSERTLRKLRIAL